MKYPEPPPNVRSLEQRIRNLEGDDGLSQRRRISMALIVVAQMMPEGAIKGGSAMALRYGRKTRFTRDLDAARISSLEQFVADFEDSLVEGWNGFTGRLIAQKPPSPAAIPAAYVMQPFYVKLSYRGQSWCTVPFELGHNELGDGENPEYVLSQDLSELFEQVGLGVPSPVPVLRSDHQIAQKLHALTEEGSERARDLVDLQLLVGEPDLDYDLVRKTCVSLFRYRKQHPWPPTVTQGEDWEQLYEEAMVGVNVLPTMSAAVEWANKLVALISNSNARSQR